MALYFESENELEFYNLDARYKLYCSGNNKVAAGVEVFVADN